MTAFFFVHMLPISYRVKEYATALSVEYLPTRHLVRLYLVYATCASV